MSSSVEEDFERLVEMFGVDEHSPEDLRRRLSELPAAPDRVAVVTEQILNDSLSSTSGTQQEETKDNSALLGEFFPDHSQRQIEEALLYNPNVTLAAEHLSALSPSRPVPSTPSAPSASTSQHTVKTEDPDASSTSADKEPKTEPVESPPRPSAPSNPDTPSTSQPTHKRKAPEALSSALKRPKTEPVESEQITEHSREQVTEHVHLQTGPAERVVDAPRQPTIAPPQFQMRLQRQQAERENFEREHERHQRWRQDAIDELLREISRLIRIRGQMQAEMRREQRDFEAVVEGQNAEVAAQPPEPQIVEAAAEPRHSIIDQLCIDVAPVLPTVPRVEVLQALRQLRKDKPLNIRGRSQAQLAQDVVKFIQDKRQTNKIKREPNSDA